MANIPSCYLFHCWMLRFSESLILTGNGVSHSSPSFKSLQPQGTDDSISQKFPLPHNPKHHNLFVLAFLNTLCLWSPIRISLPLYLNQWTPCSSELTLELTNRICPGFLFGTHQFLLVSFILCIVRPKTIKFLKSWIRFILQYVTSRKTAGVC